MNKSELYLVKAMACAVKGVETPPPEEKIDLIPFFKKAVEHKIENIIYKEILRNKDWFYNSEEIFEKWKQINLFSSVSLIKLDATVKAVCEEFEKHKVNLVLLKGAVIKNLYPEMTMRTMGDTDIILKEEEFEKAKEIFESFSYETNADIHGNPVFLKEKNYKFEAFFELSTIDNVWKKVDNIKGKDFIYTLNTEMFMYHLVTHLAKHVKYKGAGIRNLCDIYLFMKNNKINYEIVKNELEKKGLTTFFETLVKLIELVFDYKDEKLKSDALKEDALELLSFMLRYGVYGAQSENNVFVNSQLKKSITLREKIIIVFSKFFPGSKKLSDKYMYAKKCVLLLPFAWIHRLFDKRFIDKKTLKDTAGEMKKANEIMDLQADMIKKFKL